MSRRNLAEEYRPDSFKAVLGQEHPVAYLSGLIRRRQIGRSLLLHGSVGSGKTSLVRLYARALNCLEPKEDGSPCNDCTWCNEAPGTAGLFTYKMSEWEGDRKSVVSWLNLVNRTPSAGYKYAILFFDEAHLLKGEAMGALLQAVENPKERVIFCFATTAPHELRPALLSRLMHLEVRPLPADLALRLLKRVADASTAAGEPILYDTDALSLLAGLKRGHPRDLLIGLDQVAEPGVRVTVERVRFVFDVDHAGVLVNYFLALADADLARQTELIFSWREPPPAKVRWIQAFLTSLYYNDVLGKPLVLDALIHSITNERASILERFCRRLGVAEPFGLAPYWRRMMAFWPMQAADLDEATVHLRLTLFHHLVNQELPDIGRGTARAPTQTATAANGAATPATAACATGACSIEGHPFPMPDWLLDRPANDPAYPRVEDARELINRASFLTQEYGVLFNACFEVRPPLFGVETEAEGRRLVEEFCVDLQNRVRAWRGGDEGLFAHLTLYEREEDEGALRALLVVHLPRSRTPDRSVEVDCVAAAGAWCKQWRAHLRTGTASAAVSFVSGVPAKPQAWRFHWRQVLNLCAGLGEEDTVPDPVTGRPVPLLKLLKVPKRFQRDPGPVGGPLIGASALLRPDAVARASQNRMEPLSAFDARAWDWIQAGWEAKEFPLRRETKADREREVAKLRELHEADEDGFRAAMLELANRWPTRPERRRRGWRGWWPGADA